MEEYLDHLANLQHAVANRQQEVMLHELRDLQACMSSCHREFKSGGGRPARALNINILAQSLSPDFNPQPSPHYHPRFTSVLGERSQLVAL